MKTKIIKKLSVALGAALLLCGCTPKGDGGGNSDVPPISVADLMDPAKATPSMPADYYGVITETKGKALRDQLHNLSVNRYTNPKNAYDKLWELYKTSDVRPDGTIWDIYGDFAYSTSDHAGSYNKEGDMFNREHLVPKSWFNEGSPMVHDAHHLLPTDGYVNNKRNNFPFGEVSGNGTYHYTFDNYLSGTNKLGSSSFDGYTGTVFEPADCYKGDIARIYFYFVTTYYDKTLTNDDGSKVFSTSTRDTTKLYGFTDYAKNLFLKWHKEDPVSQKEVIRNNAVYAFQGNRNPFVDNPSYVSAIWEDGEATETETTAPKLEIYHGAYGSGTKVNGTSFTISDTSNHFFVAYINGIKVEESDTSVSCKFSNTAVATPSKYYERHILLKAAANGTATLTFTKTYIDKGVTKTVTESISIVVTGMAQSAGTGPEWVTPVSGGGTTGTDVTGTDYVFTATQSGFTDDNSSGVTLTTSISFGFESNDPARKMQFTGNCTITIPKIASVSKKIGKVSILCSSNNGANTIGVKVNDVAFDTTKTIGKKNHVTLEFVATAVENNTINIILTRSGNSIYIESITITFVD